MQVNIALDARAVYASQRRGTGKNLLDAYRVMARIRPHWHFLLYHRGHAGEDPFAAFDNVSSRAIDVRGDRFELWREWRLPAAARADRAALLHCPANCCPRFSAVPIVTTVHDLIPIKISDPEVATRPQRFRAQIQRCLGKSRRVIAVSQATRADLLSDFAADPERVDVITWAADSTYAPVREQTRLAEVRSRYNLQQHYMIAFSGRSRRKNAEGMMRGFARVDPERRRRSQFVVVGVEPESHRQVLRRLAARLGIDEQCRIVGFVPEAHIPPLLSGADALAYCSLYEGFGLPILDAFCCETAVLTSRVSSMPEVAGDAAVYCDPDDPGSMAAGMTRLMADEQLRRTLVARGLQRAGLFTWHRTAEAMCGVFEKCL